MLFGYMGSAITITDGAWADNGGSPRTFTITATTTVDASAGVFGIELSGPDTTPLIWSENAVGTAASQTITITGADYGYVNASVIKFRVYYNINPLDPASSRIKGALSSYTVPTV